MNLALALMFLLQSGASAAPTGELPPLKAVTLEGERPVADALEEIRRQTGLSISQNGLDPAALVTVEWKDRPVLAAMDDLCRALRKGTLRVSDDITLQGDEPLPHAVAHWRHFRIAVSDVNLMISRSLGAAPTRTLQVQLALSAQPGIQPRAVGAIEIEEAIDDTGWSLMASRPQNQPGSEVGEEGDDPDVVEFENGFNRGQNWQQMSASLRGPARGATKIERLRARFRASFPKQHVNETVPVVDLVEGKEILIGSMKFKVVSFEQKGSTATFRYLQSSRSTRDSMSSPRFQCVDSAGASLSRGGSGGGGSNREYKYEYRLNDDTPVAGLRYEAFIGRITVGVPFELKDIPLPTARRD